MPKAAPFAKSHILDRQVQSTVLLHLNVQILTDAVSQNCLCKDEIMVINNVI